MNIEKIYDLYKENLHLFNTNFNIAFDVPKTDHCEKCEEIMVKINEKITTIAEEEVHTTSTLQRRLL